MEEKKKIKICAVPSDKSGVGYFRTIWPHEYIQEHYGDEFDIDIVYKNDFPKDDLVSFLQQYDIFVFHKMLDSQSKIIDMVKFLNIPCVMDIDDAFTIGQDHPLFITSQREHWPQIIVDHLRKADYVTTTTPIFADILKKNNNEVYVIPNAIDKDSKQFIQVKKPSSRIRFGLVCGSTHKNDIELMKGISTLPKYVLDKIQICLCGFDTRGTITVYDKNTGQVKKRQIAPNESVWTRYEEFLTGNYATVSEEHKKFLKQFIAVDDPFDNEPYRRFWTRNINDYAKHYENVDVLFAPLKVNQFNKVKSPLKCEECAYTDTAIIASDFGPYTIDLVPYIGKGGEINKDGNALVVDPSKNHKLWAKYVTYVANHPECISIMKSNLKKDICDKYSIENVTKDRVKLYRKIYAERKGF
jgi:glycosyltransferase involved in cell wall biosynthesis